MACLFGIKTTLCILVLVAQSKACFLNCYCTGIEISCSGKALQEVPAFKNINGANIVDLSDNQIEIIYAEELNWRGIEQLQYLFLNANSIVYVENGSLDRFNNLELLDLSNNILENIQGNLFEKNHRLYTLNLAGNIFINNVPVIKSVSLKSLDISYSKLTYIGMEHIQYLPNLEYLNLEANNIAYLEPSFYMSNRNVQKILSLNIWACNCSTAFFYNWTKQDDSIYIGNDFFCKSDNHLHKLNTDEQLMETFCDLKENSTVAKRNNSSEIEPSLGLVLNSDCDFKESAFCRNSFVYQNMTAVILILVLVCILLAFVLGYLLAQYRPSLRESNIFCKKNKQSLCNV